MSTPGDVHRSSFIVHRQFLETDFLVLGSGIAGLWFSYRAAQAGRVLIVTKKSDTDSNTNYAQGGIASAFADNDSPDLHYQDTIRGGDGLGHEDVVRFVVNEGPALVQELNNLGVGFSTYIDSRGRQHFDLGREGGHRRARIVHARDFTGRELEHGLVTHVRSNANVTVLENRFARELVLDSSSACTGCRIIDEATGAETEIRARCTLLATGGLGQVYLYTTNPPIATGDGIAMAYRAGARIANMEFIQFHPTALYGHKIDGRAFLISEAVRGEGGLLKTRDGATFMEHYDEMGSLAPRDIVARAIDNEMKKRGDDFVLLDVTHLDPARIIDRFPNIYQQCLKFGIDITREPIPVVPAAHYVCGGVETNPQGETSVPGLFAVGECACSGLHGANRLASNSLLEALVMAERAAKNAVSRLETRNPGTGIRSSEPKVATPPVPEPESQFSTLCLRQAARLKSAMWQYASIVRSDHGLASAWEDLAAIGTEVEPLLESSPRSINVLELRNMLTVAKLIVRSAQMRKESRGLHYNVDYPAKDEVHFHHDTVITREDMLSRI